ncbi:glutamate racemase [Peptoniphilus raoultii]|uniref:glutamate racemase n=1 Tax=Peptoniphilus raoultii TaxID=1776387 RepID=UPI0008D8DD0B|nr:glutamate racemase [Peptoniphilus raoultii]
MDNKLIGFFDSGVGALSVLKVATQKLPEESYIYFGDTQRMPYGIRSSEEVEKFTCQAMGFFKEKDVKLAIIACNTATCYGLKKASEISDFPIFGVVKPAVKAALKVTKNKKVALVATEGTVKSNVYKNYFKEADPEVELRSVGCPDLVLAAEEGDLSHEKIVPIINKYLDKFEDFDYDTIILGCTHFPLARPSFEKIFKDTNRNINIVDPAEETVEEVKNYLDENNERTDLKEKKIDFFQSGNLEDFKNTLNKVVDVSAYKLNFASKRFD